jgi:hypothetical protein
LIAALATKLHSPFRGRKPGRREDHKRENKYIRDLGCRSSKHPPLTLNGEEALEKGYQMRRRIKNY